MLTSPVYISQNISAKVLNIKKVYKFILFY